jgi:hypothetical protein
MKVYVLYELTPDVDYTWDKRVLLVRERKEDLEEILATIQKSNVDFDDYIIEEVEQ